jgi:hypothetical protein
LENTWFPRVTEAPDAADDDGCAVDAPAAVAITLETSAVADATTVDVGLDEVDAPVAVPVV